MTKPWMYLIFLTFPLALLGCSSADDDVSDDDAADDDTSSDDDANDDDDTSGDDDATADLVLSSSAFADGATIPTDYTCLGQDISPPLEWSGVAAGTESFAIIMDDPDAGDFSHWAIYDIPGDVTSLAEGVSPDGNLPAGAQELMNWFGFVGYGGCCPPNVHTYEFTIWAVDTATLPIDSTAGFSDLEAAAEAAALDSAVLTGTFGPS